MFDSSLNRFLKNKLSKYIDEKVTDETLLKAYVFFEKYVQQDGCNNIKLNLKSEAFEYLNFNFKEDKQKLLYEECHAFFHEYDYYDYYDE